MEKAVFINKFDNLRKLKYFDRIYYGSEFCQNLIPDIKGIDKVFYNFNKVTLLTPPVTGYGLRKLGLLFSHIYKKRVNCEIVFNDWGVLKLIQERCAGVSPVLGRLLTKQKRDPWIDKAIFSKKDSDKILINGSRDSAVILKLKKIPKTLYKYFKSAAVNAPVFQEFLLENKIMRVEMDNLAWGMNTSVNKRLGISLHYPYGYISTTRLCGLINLTYSKCTKQCRKFFFSFKRRAQEIPTFIRGNTVFYKMKLPKIETLRRMGISRIVYYKQVPI